MNRKCKLKIKKIVPKLIEYTSIILLNKIIFLWTLFELYT